MHVLSPWSVMQHSRACAQLSGHFWAGAARVCQAKAGALFCFLAGCLVVSSVAGPKGAQTSPCAKSAFALARCRTSAPAQVDRLVFSARRWRCNPHFQCRLDCVSPALDGRPTSRQFFQRAWLGALSRRPSRLLAERFRGPLFPFAVLVAVQRRASDQEQLCAQCNA